MSTDGWQMDQGALFGEAELAALRELARQWPSLSFAERQQHEAALQARYPDLELTTADVSMIIAKIQEMGQASASEG